MSKGLFEEEKVVVFVGGKLDNINEWAMPGGILDNAAFHVLAYISDVPEVIGKQIHNGLVVQTIDDIKDMIIDDVIIMAYEYGQYYSQICNMLSDALIGQISANQFVSPMSIIRVPEIGNMGGIKFNDSVPQGKYVNIQYLMRKGQIEWTNDLEEFFFDRKHKLIDKWTHYFEVYDREFSRFREKKPRMLEIGVFKGGSLQMWSDYFGAGAEIIGVDIDPRCKEFEEDGIKIEIGSQEDPGFLNYLVEKYREFDIILDDGGHTMRQQIMTFQVLYPSVKDRGIFMCEDCHTSYMKNWGGGYRKPTSFIEYAKNQIDGLNDQFIKEDDYIPEVYAGSIKSIRFYNSIVVFEKEKIGESLRLTSKW